MMIKVRQAALFCITAGVLVAATHNPFVDKLDLEQRFGNWVAAKTQIPPPVVVADESSQKMTSSCKSESLRD